MLKKNITKKSKPYWFISLLSLLVLITGIGLATTWYQYQLNPDATAYFGIAERYAHGDFRHAINGYWGPTLSWLLIPFAWLNANLIITAKCIAIVTSVALLVVIYYYLGRLKVSNLVRNFTVAGLAPTLLLWSLVDPITPDLIFTLLLLLLVMHLDSFLQRPAIRSSVFLGIIGAGMYFTKGVGFYAFLGIIALAAAWQWYTERPTWTALLKRWRLAPIIFALLVLPFIALLSLKYDKLTINTGAAYNYSVVGPQLEWHHPLSGNIYTPPNPDATSAWEDPSTMAPLLPKWSIFDSGDHFTYFFSNILLKNILALKDAALTLGVFMTLGILLMIIALRSNWTWRREAILFTGVSTLMMSGYSIIALEARYVWIVGILGLISTALFLQMLVQKKLLSRSQLLLGGWIIVIVATVAAGHTLYLGRDTDKKTQLAAQSLRSSLPSHEHIVADNFGFSIFACHHLNLQCYGVMKPPAAVEYAKYAATLREHHITHYIEYDPASRSDANLQQFTQQYFTKIKTTPDAVVYKLK